MDKRTLKIALLSCAMVCIGAPAFAQADSPATDLLGDGEYVQKDPSYYMNGIQQDTQLGGYDDVANEGPVLTASRIINFLLLSLGTAALCLTVYAGYLWMFSRGNEEDITKAKNILTGSVIGIVIILSSWGVMNFIFRSFVDITD